jgi:hypothetical protein
MLARVSAGFCSVCGAVLRDGVCPHGHPQRAVRRLARQRRGRLRRAIAWLILIVVLGGSAYAALVWYPQRAASDVMRPSSEDFALALDAYRSTVSLFPPGATDPQALLVQSNQVLEAAGDTREDLGRASARLEQREPVSWPVISDRPPLRQARATHQDMLAFSTSARETVASVEAIAGYLTRVASVLPQLDNLEQTLAPAAAGEVDQAVAASTPIADQVLADIQAVSTPEELGGLHASLLAIAQRIRDDLDEIDRAGQQGSQPVITALVRDVRGDVGSFRETLGGAPQEAGQGGLADRRAEVDRLAAEAVSGLQALRDGYGITGLLIPELAQPMTGV